MVLYNELTETRISAFHAINRRIFTGQLESGIVRVNAASRIPVFRAWQCSVK
jgi:hypothetical protein